MKGIRFSDEDDFNEKHDTINILVLENYEKLVRYFINSFSNMNLKMQLKDSEIVGEPRICRIAFPDAMISMHINVNINTLNLKREIILKVAVEIKSHIKSFGETLRQLQIYKDCIGSSNYHELKRKLGISLDYKYSKFVYLITPDHRFDEAFKGQGFEVLDPSFFGDFSNDSNNQKQIDNF